jgi:hypothetical protein
MAASPFLSDWRLAGHHLIKFWIDRAGMIILNAKFIGFVLEFLVNSMRNDSEASLAHSMPFWCQPTSEVARDQVDAPGGEEDQENRRPGVGGAGVLPAAGTSECDAPKTLQSGSKCRIDRVIDLVNREETREENGGGKASQPRGSGHLHPHARLPTPHPLLGRPIFAQI